MVGVIFVGGIAKSGSTIIDRLLATQPGVLGLGEVDHMLDDAKLHHPRALSYGPVEQLPCSCHQNLKECPLWGPVMADILGGRVPAHADRYRLLMSQARKVSEATNSDLTIVDSSKEVGALEKVLALTKEEPPIPTEIRIVLVYRDPRDWLVSDDLKEQDRGRTRNLRIRLRRLRKWKDRYDELLELVARQKLPTAVVSLATLQSDPGRALTRVLDLLGVLADHRSSPDLTHSTTHIVWGSHHRLNAETKNTVWKSRHMRRIDIWFIPWLLSPGVWPWGTTLRRLNSLQ